MLRTRSPLLFKCIATREKPFDLHVLTTPPAFILSQDQTLRKRESRILVIHELLSGTDPKARSVLTWNMLIGGPNQSYKVNFKEPPLERGKISKRTFAFWSVNPFPEVSEKNFVKERSVS